MNQHEKDGWNKLNDDDLKRRSNKSNTTHFLNTIKMNFLTGLESYTHSFKLIWFFVFYTIITSSMIIVIPLISYYLYTNSLAKILLTNIYYVALIVLVLIIAFLGIFSGLFRKQISNKRLILWFLMYLLILNIPSLEWTFLVDKLNAFYLFCIIISVFITIFVVNEIYNSYLKRKNKETHLKNIKQMFHIIIQLFSFVTSIATIISAIELISKFINK